MYLQSLNTQICNEIEIEIQQVPESNEFLEANSLEAMASFK